MGGWLKQSTAAHIMFGPFLDKTDGVTLEVAAGIITSIDHATTGIFLSKNGAAGAIRHQNVTASVLDAYGMYQVHLDTTDTDTVGHLRVMMAEAATFLPVWDDFMVLPANVYDSLMGTDTLDVQVTGIGADVITAASINTGAFTADAFAADAIVAATLATGALTADAFAANALVAGTFAADCLAAASFATGCLTADAFAADAIVAATLATGALTADAFAANAIIAATLAADCIGASQIANGAIDAATFAAGAIDASAIANAAIDNATFAADVGSTAGATNIIALAVDKSLELAKVPKSDSTVTWNSTAAATIQKEANDALIANNLDHFMLTPVSDITKLGDGGGNEVPDSTVLSIMLCKGMDTDTYNHTTDSLESIRDKETDIETDTAVIGALGAGLTGVPWNAAWDAEVQSEVDDALIANNLDHLALTATAAADMTTEVADNTILSRIIANGDTSSFVQASDGLRPIALDVAATHTHAAAAPTAAAITDAVWDEVLHTDHEVASSASVLLQSAGGAADPLLNAVPGAYGAGTAGLALGLIDDLFASVVTNAAGADIAADIIALKAETAAILADTNELQVDDYPTSIAAVKADTAAILTDTGTTLDGRIPAALVGGKMDANVGSQSNIDFGALQKTSLNAATPASVVGAVGSVTGNVGGNVTGSVGSLVVAALKKNTALAKFAFIMTDATTHAPKAGVAPTCTRSIDGGAFGAGTLANIAEQADAVGGYLVDFGAGDLNGNVIMLRATGAGCDDTFVTLVTCP